MPAGPGRPGLGPGLKGAPGGVVHGPGVVGDAGVQGMAKPGQVSAGEAGYGRPSMGHWQERVLQGHC